VRLERRHRRTLLSMNRPRWVGVLLVLGTLVTLVAIFSIWANRQLLNTDNWVSTSSRFLANEKIDEQLAVFVADQVFENTEIEAKVGEALPPKLAPLAGPVSGGLHQLAPKIAERVLEAPRTQALWSAANRAAHESLLKVLNGGGSRVSTENGEVTLDLSAIVDQVGAQLGVGELGEKLPPDVGKITILRSEQLSAAQKVTKLIRRLPIVLTLLAFVLFGLAIYLAGPRRRRALRSAGVGFVVAGLLVLILRKLGGHYVVDNLVASETVRPAASAAWGIGTSLLRTVAASTLAFGILVFLAAWLAGPTAAATAIRRECSPYLRRNQLTAYGAAGIVFLILVAWAPVTAFRKPLGILILALLLAAGTELLRRQILREFPDYEGGDLGDRFRALTGSITARRRAAPEGGGEDEVAALARLASLHREGSLSDEEFARAKETVLGGSPRT
jgi:hypothetical protein